MEITLKRYSSRDESTGGLIFINHEFFCYSLEDQFQEVKVAKETRIPPGRYEIKFRDAGGMNEKYKARYSWHCGMLHLQNVPGFEWIYIHPGNNDDHTEGCILVGLAAVFNKEHKLQQSVSAYVALYDLIKLAFAVNELVFIVVEDL